MAAKVGRILAGLVAALSLSGCMLCDRYCDRQHDRCRSQCAPAFRPGHPCKVLSLGSSQHSNGGSTRGNPADAVRPRRIRPSSADRASRTNVHGLEEAPRPGDLPFRVGRRIIWVDDALAPLRGRLPERDRHRLVLAIAAAVGIDALVWLTDIAGLSRPQAVELMRWSARALFETALAGDSD